MRLESVLYLKFYESRLMKEVNHNAGALYGRERERKTLSGIWSVSGGCCARWIYPLLIPTVEMPTTAFLR